MDPLRDGYPLATVSVVGFLEILAIFFGQNHVLRGVLDEFLQIAYYRHCDERVDFHVFAVFALLRVLSTVST